MTEPQRYAPARGKRVVHPSGGDWPTDGLPVDMSNPYQARLVRDGDLVPVAEPKKRRSRTPAAGGQTGTETLAETLAGDAGANTDGGDA